MHRSAAGRSRLARKVGLAGFLLALAVSAPAHAAGGGGTRYSKPPVISKLSCKSLCVDATATAQSKTVATQERGLLAVKGRNLDSVDRVVFLGRKGGADDVRRVPVEVTEKVVNVSVPSGAHSGSIRLVDVAGRKSAASKATVKVVPALIPPTTNYIWPVKGSVSSLFGENRGDHYHAGVDILSPSGTPIKAVAPGRVSMVGPQGAYGNFVCITHTKQTSCYAHLSAFKTTKGAIVNQGDVIGDVGCTGRCSGDHVHFEIREGTADWSTPIDPLPLLPKRASATAARNGPPMDWDLPVNGPGS